MAKVYQRHQISRETELMSRVLKLAKNEHRYFGEMICILIEEALRQRKQGTEMSDIQCDVCGGDLCPHGICRDNWCGHESHCQECADRDELEKEADANAEYYRRIPGESFE